MLKTVVKWSSVAAILLAPVQGFAQYRDPGGDVGAAVVGGAVGGALGGVLSGWQERQRHHEERMERERWRQAHGGRPFPGDLGAGGPPDGRPDPRADGRPPFDGRGRPARYGDGRGPDGRGRPEGFDGPRRPGPQERRPAPQGGEPDDDAR